MLSFTIILLCLSALLVLVAAIPALGLGANALITRPFRGKEGNDRADLKRIAHFIYTVAAFVAAFAIVLYFSNAVTWILLAVFFVIAAALWTAILVKAHR